MKKRKYLLKRMGCFLLSMVMILSTLEYWTKSSISQTEAASAINKFAWRGDDGNIYLRTEDHKRTSDICYRTLGWTITRCELGTTNTIDDQYITVRFNGATQVPIGGGFTTSAFSVSEAEFLSKIAAVAPDWLADIQSGKTCYVMFDAIMITWDYSLDETAQPSGIMVSDNNKDYLTNDDNPIPGVYDKDTKDDLKYKTYGWAYPENIETHFNIPLLYNGGEDEEPVRSDEFVQTTGKSLPDYYTWNTSSQFDLSQGIPSGEDITNGVGADKWYGNFSIGSHTAERVYHLTYDFVYYTVEYITTTEYETNPDGSYKLDANGKKIVKGQKIETVQTTHHLPKVFSLTRTASYYYLLGINLYELTGASVYNSTYPLDRINYNWGLGEIDVDVEKDNVMNPREVTDWTSKENLHVKFPDDYTDVIVMECGMGYGAAIGLMNLVEQAIYDDQITSADYIKAVESKNDLVRINGITYMDNEWVSHANDTTINRIPYKILPTGKDDSVYAFTEKSTTVKIPETVANGSYITDMELTYKKRALNTEETRAVSASAMGDSIQNHLKPGYEKNEPVNVHTPVISPVKIVDGEQETQLVEDNKSNHTGPVDKDGRVDDGKALYELILDHEYTFKFDAALHQFYQNYGWSGDPSKYDKYVKGKWARFPFDVRVNGTFYDVTSTGFTDWIEVDQNETTFYIPPWALEKDYYEIEYKVEAYNVIDENMNDHSEDTEGTANLDRENYVATYVVPVELSGIIYGFEVIGTNDDSSYSENPSNAIYTPYNFTIHKEEKKTGTKNRLGESVVRYTLDGTLEPNWSLKNALPLCNLSSWTMEDTGYIKKGTTIDFSVKTIANLWDENTDYIRIKPTFRYMDAAGNINEDIQVYYRQGSQFIRYTSEEDMENDATAIYREDSSENKNYIRKVNLWNENFTGSAWDGAEILLSSDINAYDGEYHDRDLLYTLAKHNTWYTDDMEIGEFLTRESEGYSLSSILLSGTNRILTGNYEELAINLDKERNELTEFALNKTVADKFEYSMQTWYGRYWIPTELYVCDGNTFEDMGIPDTDNNGIVDLWDYAVSTDQGVDGNEDFWYHKQKEPDGYLIVNFDITSFNENEPHLSYSSGTKDMWKTEGAPEEVPIGDRFDPDRTIQIPVESGDVAFIHLGESITDGWSVKTFMIN